MSEILNQRQSDGTAAPGPESSKNVNGGCHARLVGCSSFSDVGLNRTDRITKNVPKLTSLVFCLGLGICVSPFASAADSTPQGFGVVDITFDQSGLGKNVWSHSGVALPHKSRLAPVGALQGVSTAEDELLKTPSADVGFAGGDGTASGNVPVLGEIMSGQPANKSTCDCKTKVGEGGKVGACDQVYHSLVGGIMGLVVGVLLLVLILRFLNQRQSDGTAAPGPESSKNVNGGCHARLV